MSVPERPCTRKLLGLDNLKEVEEGQSLEFQSAVVKALCARYRIGRRDRLRLLTGCRSFDFDDRYCLAAFNRRYPLFPLILFAKKYLNVVKENPLHKMLADLPNRPFVKEFLALRVTVPQHDRPIGLVFHWPDIDGICDGKSALVVHDWTGPERQMTGECVLEMGKNKPGKRIYVDSLPQLLNAIDKSCPMYKPRLWMD